MLMSLPIKRRNGKPGSKKMEIEETKKTVVEKYLEECGTTIDKLKERIARYSIDWNGAFGNCTQLLRILRGKNEISIEFYRTEDGTDGYNNHDRFWFEFPHYYYRDLSSGRNISEDNGNVNYEIIDENQVRKPISFWDLRAKLINDLVGGHEGFKIRFEDFIEELYDWIIEPDEGATPSMTNKPT